MMANAEGARLFVANSDADSVSVIDTATDQEIERIDVRLAEDALPAQVPKGWRLTTTSKLCTSRTPQQHHRGRAALRQNAQQDESGKITERPKIEGLGFIPTGQYPPRLLSRTVSSSSGMARHGFEPSSMRVNDSGRTPNPPNAAFPPNKEKTAKAGSTAARLFQETSAWSRCPICRNSRDTPGKLCRTTSDGFRARETFPRSKPHQTRYLHH